MIFGYIAIGALAGFLGGAFGVGGGIILVPALLIIFKQPIHVAIGTSMMIIIPIAISGALRHYTLHNIEMNVVLFAGIGGIIGAILGATVIMNVPAIYVKRTLALILLYSAIRLWFTK